MTDWIEWAREQWAVADAKSRESTLAQFLKQGYTQATAEEMTAKHPFQKLGDISEFVARADAIERGTVRQVRPVTASRHKGIYAIQHQTEIPWVEGVWVDLGLSLVHGKTEVPVSRDMLFKGRHGTKAPEVAKFPYQLDQDAFAAIVAPHAARLVAEWDALADQLQDRAVKTALATKAKLDRTAVRVETPAAKEKREREARERAVSSFTALLYRNRALVGDLGPQDVAGLLDVASRKERLLAELAQWVKQYPLGSKVVGLQDIETALDQARVKEVLDS